MACEGVHFHLIQRSQSFLMLHRFTRGVGVWCAFKGLDDVPESALMVVGGRRDEISPTFLPSLPDRLLSFLAGRQPLFSVAAHFLP